MTYIKIHYRLLLISLTFSSISYCQTNTKNSSTNDNNSIFKIPQPRGNVNDYEGLFSIAQRKSLDSLLKNFESRTTIQIVIISIDTTMVSRDSFEDFTLSVLKTWGVGQKGKNNGVLIGISAGYGMLRIQNGYGIEKIFVSGVGDGLK